MACSCEHALLKGFMQNAYKMRTKGTPTLDGLVSRHQFSHFVRQRTDRWFNAPCNVTGFLVLRLTEHHT